MPENTHIYTCKHVFSCKETLFPLVHIPQGERVPQETVEINEVGMEVEWKGMEEKGREQT